MIAELSPKIEDHAELLSFKGDITQLKQYLRSQGYVVVYSGVDGYDVIFDRNKFR